MEGVWVLGGCLGAWGALVRWTDRQTGGQTGRQVDRRTGRQVDRQTGGQADR